MNRFSLREFALLCAPMAFLGLGVIGPRLLHPSKDPGAVISLSVREIPTNFGDNPHNPRLQFAWQADASGGPQSGYRIGFQEQIVAITKTGEKIIYSDPPVARSANALVSGGSGSTPGKSSMMSRVLQIDSEDVPVTAKYFEWRGEFVAAPRESGSINEAASAATLAKWAKIKGAARVQKVIRIPYDTSKNAILSCEIEPVNAENASKGADTCITVESRYKDSSLETRRISRRLVAFDGQKTRVLWDDFSPGRNPYWHGNSASIFSSRETDNLLFKLRDVPAAWGEIVYLFDAVYLDATVESSGQASDFATIERLQKAGGARFSRRLVVREVGQTIAAPSYKKTPNLQLLRIETSKNADQTQITVVTRYLGNNADPRVDSDWGARFVDEKGVHLKNLNSSWRVQKGAKPGEYVCIITLKTAQLQGRRDLQMQLKIGDEDAAPLVIQQKIALP